MTLKDFRDRIISLFGKPSMETSSRPDGGTSCYRPMRKRNHVEMRDENVFPQEPEQQIPYVHTGFTGMNPPTAGYGQSAGYFRHEEEVQPQAAYTGYAGQTPAGAAGGAADNWGNSGSGGASSPAAAQDNISYMPGVFAPDAGNSYTHVAHIMAMTSLKTCYEAIECMKNGESLILTLDLIPNESEALRCQDMLAGAAFTLGCNVRMLNSARIVLITPESVKILPEQAPGRSGIGVPPAFNTPQPQQEPAAPATPPRRERRVSQRTAEWEAARRGEMRNYNPYTGNRPAAAGEYSRYGGY